MLVAPEMLHMCFQRQTEGLSAPKHLVKRNTDNLYAEHRIQPNQYPAILLMGMITVTTVFRVANYQPIWSDLLPSQTNADCPSKR